MRFEEALKAMREGEKITRPELILDDFQSHLIQTEFGVFYRVISLGDYGSYYRQLDALTLNNILAEDWEVVE